MSISIKEYVDITSGVGAGTAVRQRELITRYFTTSDVIPAGSVVEVTELADVAALFGTDSEEYRRAATQFGWISKTITAVKKISFAHWAQEAAPPAIQGGSPLLTLATWKGITDGALDLQVGTEVSELRAMDFSAATSLADVAGIVQADIRGAAGGNFANATVTFDNVAQRFNATFPGAQGAAPATVTLSAPDEGADVIAELGWDTAAFGEGSAAQTPVEALTASSTLSDNFGAIAFIPELELADWQAVGAWVQAQNVSYMAMVPVTYGNRATWYAALGTYGGICLTLVAAPNVDHDEDIPAIIMAATDYTKRNAAPNYMFNSFSGITPKVTSTAISQALNALRINYYGQTQTAGSQLSFYQRGIVCGTSSTPSQMGVFANEIWLKSAATSNLMTLLLSLPLIPATEEGRSMVMASLQDVIDRALFNGTIAVGKELTTSQRLYVTQITGDELAWHQVESIGWWLDAVVSETTSEAGVVEYAVDYTLVYSKADAVNKITGRDILI